jgi:prepilin-type N-terminal cleavage/methylation domain-containing protein
LDAIGCGYMMKNNKGFTLIELITALAIFSILATLTFSVLIYSNKSFNNQVSDIENLTNVRNGISYITREIRKANTIEVTNNILTLDGTNVYRSENNTITKNGTVIIPKIYQLNIVKAGSKIDIEIISTDEKGIGPSNVSSTIYLR